MPFSEKTELTDERRPLLRDPVWHHSHRYGQARGYNPDDMEEFIRYEQRRNQKFQWMLFLGVTFLSILILLATLVVLIKLSYTHPAYAPVLTTTTPPPFSKEINDSLPSLPPFRSTSLPSLPVSSTTAAPGGVYIYVNDTSTRQ